MSKNFRYQLETSYNVKKAHKQMLKHFNTLQISVGKRKGGTELIYFSVKDKEEGEKIEAFLSERKLNFKQIS